MCRKASIAMIKTREDLKRYLKEEKTYYITRKTLRDQLIEWVTQEPCVRIWKYQKTLRYTEYFCNQTGIKKWIFYPMLRRRKNRLGLKLGLEIVENSFDQGLIIYHTGNIIVNGYARIGKNCCLHGSNCIGNNGITEETPRIGDRVDIGVGAKIIGGVQIADDITIGAGAVVNKSFLTPGVVIGGIPAKVIRNEGRKYHGSN